MRDDQTDNENWDRISRTESDAMLSTTATQRLDYIGVRLDILLFYSIRTSRL